MFKKDHKLNQWLWKWHFIAGLISLPIVILLAITGGVYLFKDTYEAPKQEPVKVVKVEGNPISFQEQWDLAQANSKKPFNSMVIPSETNQATAFISGRFGHKKSIFVNPYKAEISGVISPKDSDMHTVRKLHGELLLGTFGTKIVELTASWLFVLIITGIYVFWPSNKGGLKSFFTIRTKLGKRIMYRDLHTVFGFWISVLLLMTLIGAMPWTDVFGGNFKTVQKLTDMGFPKTWNGNGLKSEIRGDAIVLDNMVAMANTLDLKGKVSVGLPKNKAGVYIIFNETFDLGAQKRFYYDQYSGEQIMQHNWADVGILMRGRMWFMVFHQGQFGFWNWVVMLGVAVLLTFISIASLISYIKRKPKGKWGTPKVPSKFKVGYGVITLIVLLGIVFPLFGISALLIVFVELFLRRQESHE